MTAKDLSDQPATDGKPATEAPVVAGAGDTFDDLDSSTPLSVDSPPEDSERSEPGPDSG